MHAHQHAPLEINVCFSGFFIFPFLLSDSSLCNDNTRWRCVKQNEIVDFVFLLNLNLATAPTTALLGGWICMHRKGRRQRKKTNSRAGWLQVAPTDSASSTCPLSCHGQATHHRHHHLHPHEGKRRGVDHIHRYSVVLGRRPRIKPHVTMSGRSVHDPAGCSTAPADGAASKWPKLLGWVHPAAAAACRQAAVLALASGRLPAFLGTPPCVPPLPCWVWVGISRIRESPSNSVRRGCVRDCLNLVF